MQSLGVIGPMMKVGPDGKTEVIDPKGELPGTLVPRPFAEYPKAVRRVQVDKETGAEKVLTFVAGSKSEELRIMSDTSELDVPRSPLERERDALAEDLSVTQKMNGQLATQLENALARIEQLANSVQKLEVATSKPKMDHVPEKNAGSASASGVEALALLNKKQ